MTLLWYACVQGYTAGERFRENATFSVVVRPTMSCCCYHWLDVTYIWSNHPQSDSYRHRILSWYVSLCQASEWSTLRWQNRVLYCHGCNGSTVCGWNATNVDHGLNVHHLCPLDVAECVKLTSILNFCPLHADYLDGPVLSWNIQYRMLHW